MVDPLKESSGGSRTCRAALLATLALAGWPCALVAQGRLDAIGGISYALPPQGVTGASSTYLSAGLQGRLDVGPRSLLFAGAQGGVSASTDVGDWAWGQLGGRLGGPLGRGAELSLQASLEGFTVGLPNLYRAIDARLSPELRLRTLGGWLAVRGEGGVGGSRVREASSGSLLGPVLGDSTRDVTSDLWSAGGGGELRVPAGPAWIHVGIDLYRARDGGYESYTGGVDVPVGAAIASAEARLWGIPGDRYEPSASVVLSVPLGKRARAYATGGRSDPDPLLGTRPGGYAAASASVRIAGGSALGPAGGISRVPARHAAYEITKDGRVRFHLRRPEADSVFVAGDFSEWRRLPLHRRRGRWRLELRLPPGLYHYGFVVDGKWYVPEDAAGRGTDEWGRPTGTLIVPSRGADPPVTPGAGRSSERQERGGDGK